MDINYQNIINKLKNNGLTLKYLSEYLRDDYKAVLQAVKQNGNALFFASDRLKNNNNIVTAAITNDPGSIYWAGRDCQLHPDIEKIMIGKKSTKTKLPRKKYSRRCIKKTRKIKPWRNTRKKHDIGRI